MFTTAVRWGPGASLLRLSRLFQKDHRTGKFKTESPSAGLRKSDFGTSLLQTAPQENLSALQVVLPGSWEDGSRIVVPGEPDRSVLLYRMRSRRPSSQIPPLGTTLPDKDAVELLRRWIESTGPRSVRD